jgi:hypothetical protein
MYANLGSSSRHTPQNMKPVCVCVCRHVPVGTWVSKQNLCKCVYMYLCMYASVCGSMCVRVHAWSRSLRTQKHTSFHESCMILLYVSCVIRTQCLYVCMCSHQFLSSHTFTDMCTCKHTCIHTHACICRLTTDMRPTHWGERESSRRGLDGSWYVCMCVNIYLY